MQHYLALEKEALACLWVVEHFEKNIYLANISHYILINMRLGSYSLVSAKVESVCKASKYICWVEHLSTYDFDISYHQGEENLVPDALSHLPLPADSEAVDDYYMTHMICQIHSQGISADKIWSCMEAEPALPVACCYVEQGWPHKAKIPEKL